MTADEVEGLLTPAQEEENEDDVSEAAAVNWITCDRLKVAYMLRFELSALSLEMPCGRCSLDCRLTGKGEEPISRPGQVEGGEDGEVMAS